LDAASEAFATEGLGVSLAEIARRAGVGNATVHRNYAGKQALLDELFSDWFARRRAAAEKGLANPDAWLGLVEFLEDALADAVTSRGAGELYAIRLRGRERLDGPLSALIKRAQKAGVMRTDVNLQDVSLLLLGISRTIEITRCAAPQQWRRHLAVVLDGLRDSTSGRMPGRPIQASELDAALREWSGPLVGRGD
jgi:AcrR family transcriptional regulator